MAHTSTHLYFERSTEEAFNFYKLVFGTEFDRLIRLSDVPVPEGHPGPSDEDKNLIMNVELPILGGHILVANDAPESMGFKMNQGNNFCICLHPDTRSEADSLFTALSAGGKVDDQLQECLGDYWGTCFDKFGIQWMVKCSSKT
jgi:PhnB protein